MDFCREVGQVTIESAGCHGYRLTRPVVIDYMVGLNHIVHPMNPNRATGQFEVEIVGGLYGDNSWEREWPEGSGLTNDIEFHGFFGPEYYEDCDPIEFAVSQLDQLFIVHMLPFLDSAKGCPVESV